MGLGKANKGLTEGKHASLHTVRKLIFRSDQLAAITLQARIATSCASFLLRLVHPLMDAFGLGPTNTT